MREFHESHDGIATLATKRVDDTSQFGVAITGADGRIQGFQEKPDPAEALSDLANCGIYMFRSGDLRLLPRARHQQGGRPDDPTASPTGRWTSSRACSRATCLLLARDRRLLERHRQPRGAAREHPRRAHGAVEVDLEGELVDGFRSGTPQADEGALVGPVLLGAGCEIGDDVRIDGPAVIGDGARVGAGSRGCAK